MRDSLGTALCYGIEDRHVNGLLRCEQLYRESWAHKAAWRLGWELANVLTQRPLRTKRKAAQQAGKAGSDG